MNVLMIQRIMSIRMIKPKCKPSKLTDAQLQGWVSRNEGVGLGAAMKRFGWNKEAEPATSVVVTLGSNGPQ